MAPKKQTISYNHLPENGIITRPKDLYIDRCPTRFLFEKYQPPECLLTAMDAAAANLKNGGAAYIVGPAGSGKTWMSVALCFAIEEYLQTSGIAEEGLGEPPLFIRAAEILLWLRDAYRHKSGGESEYELVESFSTNPCLIIDDLGTHKDSEWSRDLFYQIIDRRYADEYPTIFTSNFGLKHIASQYDDRWASRMAEWCALIDMSGQKDRRLAK